MSQPCAIQDCKRASRTLCHCCNQNLCREHFNQHDDILNSQLNPLTDEINTLADRLRAINIDEITDDSLRKLNQWRLDCHQTIDRLYEQKCQELNRCVNKSIDEQRKAIADLCSGISELIKNQEATKNDIDLLTSTIRRLEQQMNEIEHICVQVDIRPLTIDNNLIQIGRAKVHQFDLSNLPPPHGTIEGERVCSYAMAANDRFLLAHVNGNLCLIGEDLTLMKQTQWKHSSIINICWSLMLGCFFVISEKDVFLVNQSTMSIEQVKRIEGGNWWACGCSNKSLYLSRDAWDSSVLEYSLLPSIQFVKLWQTTDQPQRKQQIDAIVYNNETLALAINDQSIQTKLIELRSSETFSLLWSTPLDVKYNNSVVRCCLLNHSEWLLADWSTSHLFHITNEGKVKKRWTHTSKPYNISFFGSNTLIILSDKGVNFHKL